MNQKRAEAGLDPLEWDENLANEAMRRAEEIASNFSHDGVPDGCAENILAGDPDDSVKVWYGTWNGSSGHRANMMNEVYDNAACASVVHDGKRYIVTLFSAEPEVRGATEEEQAAVEESMKDAVVIHEDPNTGAQTLMPRSEVEALEEQGIDPESMVISQDDLTEEQKSNLEEALRQLGLD